LRSTGSKRGFWGYELHSSFNFGPVVDGQRYYDRDAKWAVAALARLYRVQPTIRAALARWAYARKYPSKPRSCTA
jgi:hypothetical protein